MGHEKNGRYSAAIKSCLFTRYGLKDKKTQDRFWEHLPANFEVYKQATIANGDRIRAADHHDQPEEDTDNRDATFIRVSNCLSLVLTAIQSHFPTVLAAQGYI